MNYFRFENLYIWKDSIELGDLLFDIADIAENRKLFRFSEQLRGATMSISNNIAEGSGSFSDKEFGNFLNIARRSVFDCANILFIYQRRKIISEKERLEFYSRLLILSKRITTLRRSLKLE